MKVLRYKDRYFDYENVIKKIRQNNGELLVFCSIEVSLKDNRHYLSNPIRFSADEIVYNRDFEVLNIPTKEEIEKIIKGLTAIGEFLLIEDYYDMLEIHNKITLIK